MLRNRSDRSSGGGPEVASAGGATRLPFPFCKTLDLGLAPFAPLASRILDSGISADEIELDREGARKSSLDLRAGGLMARQQCVARSTRASRLLMGRYPYPEQSFCTSAENRH